MRYKLKLFLYAIVFIFGIIIGIILIKYNEVLSILDGIDWTSLLYWLAIFIGAAIPITLYYFSIKKQEVIKLKAKIAQDKIDIIRDYKNFDFQMRATVVLNKTVQDLSFNYIPTDQDSSAPSLRGLYILLSMEVYNEWKIKHLIYTEKLNGLNSPEVSTYTFYILNYILNLEILIENISNEDLWEVAIAVKNDFFDMSNELNKILDKYMNSELFTLRIKSQTDNKRSTQKMNQKLENSNLFIYRSELCKLKTTNK